MAEAFNTAILSLILPLPAVKMMLEVSMYFFFLSLITYAIISGYQDLKKPDKPDLDRDDDYF